MKVMLEFVGGDGWVEVIVGGVLGKLIKSSVARCY